MLASTRGLPCLCSSSHRQGGAHRGNRAAARVGESRDLMMGEGAGATRRGEYQERERCQNLLG
jgi:hypothetical protein